MIYKMIQMFVAESFHQVLFKSLLSAAATGAPPYLPSRSVAGVKVFFGIVFSATFTL